MNIEIKWIFDDHDCDTCGNTWSSGAIIKFDGQEVMNLKPVASCFGGTHFDDTEVLRLIIEKLGHTITETNNEET